MKIIKYTHACVRLERDGRVLVDWAETAVAEPLVRKLATELIGRDPGPLPMPWPASSCVRPLPTGRSPTPGVHLDALERTHAHWPP